MRRYNLHFAEEFQKLSPLEAVESAYESAGKLVFVGESEQVPVRFEGSVTMYRRTMAVRRLLEFSGVITDGERGYFASMDEDQPAPAYFVMDMDDKQRPDR